MAAARRKPASKPVTDAVDFSDKKKAVMFLFAQQSKDVRESILNDLPAYHALLSLEADSFEELALQISAEKRGIPYSKFDLPNPECPHCGSDENVNKKTGYIYRCKSCDRTFVSNHDSISFGSKCDALTWMKVLHCILNFISISETCSRCGINKLTYYSIRNRLFYGMEVLLERVKLYGEVQIDHTYERMSYKGSNLQVIDVPEDSVFYDETFKPRPGRKRGERNHGEERNANSVCVYTAIDDRGHVIARYVGVGKVGFRQLKQRIPVDKFLLEVPETDPFGDLIKPQVSSPQTVAGEKTIIVADKEDVLKTHAQHVGAKFEAHVYRRDGIQLHLPEGSRNIQRANALDGRCKAFLRKCNYVSSKFLPGYLTLFEFLENTGGSERAINELFRILATPNLGKPSSFYQEMYTVPNYLLEWFDDKSVLKKLPYNKVRAFYLYDHIRHKEEYPNTDVTMGYIEKETGYTAPTIRKFYKDLNQAGYREKILRFMGEPVKAPLATDRRRSSAATFNPTVLAIYDEYTKLRLLPDGQRPTLAAFLDEKNAQYGTSYKRTNMIAKFKKIEESGIRPPLPEINREDGVTERRRRKAIQISDDYDKLRIQYRERGEKIPSRFVLTGVLAERYGLSRETICDYISEGHGFQSKLDVQGSK